MPCPHCPHCIAQGFGGGFDVGEAPARRKRHVVVQAGTANAKILLRLYRAGVPLAGHEFALTGVSGNSLGTRLPELAAAGFVTGATRKGQGYKEWALTANGRYRAAQLVEVQELAR